MQMGKAGKYFADFPMPMRLNGMGDLFELGLLSRLGGLYCRDYAKHMGDFNGWASDDYRKDTAFDAVVLAHAHVDHAAYIHYLRPDIPIYCSEATKLIMQGLQDTGSREEYVTFKQNFQIYKNSKGEMSKARGGGEEYQEPRKITLFENHKSFKIDSIEIEPLAVDHSLPGVTALIIHTSKGSIGYTADIRYHGRRATDTQAFVDRCGESELDLLLCEGTRKAETFSKTEFEVEQDVMTIVNKTKKIVVCLYLLD